jgi:hypothetical protein
MENKNSKELEGQRVAFGQVEEQQNQSSQGQSAEGNQQRSASVLHRPGFHELGEFPSVETSKSGNHVIPALKAAPTHKSPE